MRTSATVRKSAALCFAALVSAGALASAATAHAAPSQSDCTQLNTLNSGFSTAVQDVIDPKDLEKLAKGSKSEKEAFGEGMVKRLFETDPVTGRRRMELFIEHIRDLDALAHDADGKFEDPEGAGVVQKLADGLDGYLGFFDKLMDESDSKQQGQDGEETGGAVDKQALLDEMGPVLSGFSGGIDTFTDYSSQAGCTAV
ncbi:MAG: hypothetical protein ACRC20_01745 [Segniliparus sp.]|uniref:hypothetical protein n=1 Tax=Segniliparus sp. TaxID=2804064 RepID=UPI003F3FDC88